MHAELIILLYARVINLHEIHLILDTGDAFAWGKGEYGALGIGSVVDQYAPLLVKFAEKNSKIIQVSCGSQHTAFVD